MEDVRYDRYHGQIWSGDERVESSRNSSLESALRSDNENEFINFPSYGHDERRVEKCDSGPELDHLIGNTVAAMDDMDLQQLPTQQVDYLSHDWREEDLWASWRHIVSTKDAHSSSARLENAAWRMWGRMRTNLQIISRESIEWKTDGDVKWLYGPFQVGRNFHPDAAASSHEQVSPGFRHLQDADLETTGHLLAFDSKIASMDSIEKEPPRMFGSQKPRPRRALSKPKKLPFLFTRDQVSSAPKKNVRFHQIVHQCIMVDTIFEDGEIDEDDISSQSTLSEWDSEPDCVVFKSLCDPGRKKSIRGLPPTILNDEGTTNPVVIGEASSWEPENSSFYPSNLIWLDAASPDDAAHKPQLMIPTPFSASTPSYQVIEAYLDNPYELSDEECFGMEMIGGDIQQVTSRCPPLDEIEEMCSLSPSISEDLNSESDESDDYDHLQPQHLALKRVADFQLEWQRIDIDDDEATWWDGV